MKLIQIEADDFGAAQRGPEDEVHNCPVPQRPGMLVHGGCLVTATVAAAGRSGRRRGGGGVQGDPGEQRRQMGEVTVS
ncbi:MULTISPECIES: hypothetical protein [unclassified Nonomuraea]|uniref:hypothetical protein n=1 Tax=unclassified Nonomuraea TaxID=2593643 RepID=UPI0033C170FE